MRPEPFSEDPDLHSSFISKSVLPHCIHDMVLALVEGSNLCTKYRIEVETCLTRRATQL